MNDRDPLIGLILIMILVNFAVTGVMALSTLTWPGIIVGAILFGLGYLLILVLKE